MVNHKSVFTALAFLLSAVAYVPYTASVLSGDAHPTISSWISWGIMDVAILVGVIAAGEMAWQMVAYITGAAVVVMTSVWKGAAMGWTRLDFACFAIVIVAVALWTISKEPNVLIVLCLVATTIGTIPTITSVWTDPGREPPLPWLLIVAGSACGVLAIKKWNIAGALTPICFLALQITVLLIIYR
ncbi:MAG: hypothetical protein Q7R91_02045 [bacterium]|nr:hypothetical protein [bacterium]